MDIRRRIFAAALCLVCLSAVCHGGAVQRTGGRISAGSDWSTPYYVVDSKVAGPTVMITGGMHGNEPAGARAAEHIRFWTIRRGKLIIVPRLNPAALEAGKRWIPDAPRERSDLNRNLDRKSTRLNSSH